MLADKVYDDVFSAMDEVYPLWRGGSGPTGRWTWVEVSLLPPEPGDNRYDVLIWRAGQRFSRFKQAIQRKLGPRVRNVFAVRYRDFVAGSPDAGGLLAGFAAPDVYVSPGAAMVRRARRVLINRDAAVFNRRSRRAMSHQAV